MHMTFMVSMVLMLAGSRFDDGWTKEKEMEMQIQIEREMEMAKETEKKMGRYIWLGCAD